ncbi:unnamed protein product [Caenorhabditis nigoni]
MRTQPPKPPTPTVPTPKPLMPGRRQKFRRRRSQQQHHHQRHQLDCYQRSKRIATTRTRIPASPQNSCDTCCRVKSAEHSKRFPISITRRTEIRRRTCFKITPQGIYNSCLARMKIQDIKNILGDVSSTPKSKASTKSSSDFAIQKPT